MKRGDGMEKNDRKNGIVDDSMAGLRGKQSVRTTFKLTDKAIEALSIMSYQLGIKQKSLFDHLVDDIQLLREIAESVEQKKRGKNCVAKTYVISRRTLENLDIISTRYSTPRDLLVEVSIERLLPLIEQEKQKHEKRKQLHAGFCEILHKAEEMILQSEQELGEDDPVLGRYGGAVAALAKSVREMEGYLERASKVERF